MLDFKILKKLYSINSVSRHEEEMKKFLVNYLKTHYTGLKVKLDPTGNIYVTKGKSKEYPVVVAHYDQVQWPSQNELVVIQKNRTFSAYDSVTGKQCGLGADDKNGIWICLMLLRTEPVLKCVFFPGEEIGCIGSSNCDMRFFKDAKYVLQCDRRGNKDIIYETYSTELCEYDFIPDEVLIRYGYFPAYGLMTDVETLKENGLKVACCNISCGYYNPHTSYETTNVDDLINCLNFVKEIIAITPYTKHIYNDSKNYYKNVYGNYGGYGIYRGSTVPRNSETAEESNFYSSDYYSKYYGWDIASNDDLYY